ncbi:MAG: hypothetical protein GXO48_05065 [Chlorobi bacterium]|nr:hypothetical protein [Chlorobiota bacterium]
MWFLWARWRYVRRRKKQVDIAFQDGAVGSPLKIVVVSENGEVSETIKNMSEALIYFPKKQEGHKQDSDGKEIIITRKDMKWFKPLRGDANSKFSKVQGDVLVIGCKKMTPEILNLIMNFSDLLVVSCAEPHWLKWADMFVKSRGESQNFWNSVEKIFFEKLNLAEK